MDALLNAQLLKSIALVSLSGCGGVEMMLLFTTSMVRGYFEEAPDGDGLSDDTVVRLLKRIHSFPTASTPQRMALLRIDQ